MDSGLERGGGGGCLLGCPSAFSSSFVFIRGGGIPSSTVSYCVGPGGVSECLYPPVGRAGWELGWVGLNRINFSLSLINPKKEVRCGIPLREVLFGNSLSVRP